MNIIQCLGCGEVFRADGISAAAHSLQSTHQVKWSPVLADITDVKSKEDKKYKGPPISLERVAQEIWGLKSNRDSGLISQGEMYTRAIALLRAVRLRGWISGYWASEGAEDNLMIDESKKQLEEELKLGGLEGFAVHFLQE